MLVFLCLELFLARADVLRVTNDCAILEKAGVSSRLRCTHNFPNLLLRVSREAARLRLIAHYATEHNGLSQSLNEEQAS